MTHESEWMKPTVMCLVFLAMLVSGCASAKKNEGALCDATLGPRAEHASALAADGGDQSLVTGARLIALIDAGCDDV